MRTRNPTHAVHAYLTKTAGEKLSEQVGNGVKEECTMFNQEGLWGMPLDPVHQEVHLRHTVGGQGVPGTNGIGIFAPRMYRISKKNHKLHFFKNKK